MISVWTPVASWWKKMKKYKSIKTAQLYDLYFKTMWLYDVWQLHNFNLNIIIFTFQSINGDKVFE